MTGDTEPRRASRRRISLPRALALAAGVLAATVGVAWAVHTLGSAPADRASAIRPVVGRPYVSKATASSASVFLELEHVSRSAILTLTCSSGNSSVTKRVDATDGLHEVALTGLLPGAPQEYAISILEPQSPGEEEVLARGQFVTAPTRAGPFRFAVYGDTQKHPEIHKPIADAIAAEKPDFVLHVGDLTQDGLDEPRWPHEFFTPARLMLFQCAIFPVIGNHENDAPLYFQLFGLPLGKAWYTFSWGNVDFFVVDSIADFQPASEQWKWLKAALEASTATWKIVAHHYPFISSRKRFMDQQMNESLRPLFEQYGVCLVFSGHEHNYARTRPLLSSAGESACPITYITVGPGGGPLRPVTRGPWDAVACSCRAYMVVDVSGESLVMVAKDASGRVFDTLTLTKGDASYSKRALVIDRLPDP
ncbi:MAG TPA: metallophosphoesterase [Planctomycetota bacterium]|nr:metallophosphoesterase [Planctomycetota bacterium]